MEEMGEEEEVNEADLTERAQEAIEESPELSQ